MHDDNFWDMLKKLSVMIDERFKRCEWIHNALNIQTRLESEGKKVLFYEWDMCQRLKKVLHKITYTESKCLPSVVKVQIQFIED